MTEFKVGDRVRIVKNKKGELIVFSPFESCKCCGKIYMIQGFNGNNVYLSGFFGRVDISCIEHVNQVLKIKIPEIQGTYVYKSSNGGLRLSTEAPKLDKYDWRDSGRQYSAKGLIIDLSQFNWDDSLHMINDDYTLTKIEPEVYPKYTVDFNGIICSFPKPDNIKDFYKFVEHINEIKKEIEEEYDN